MVSSRALVFAGVAAACLPGISIAQDSANRGYVVDADQNPNIVTSGYGLCWHDSYWMPGRAIPRCDGVSDQHVQAPAPMQVAEAPPPPQPVAFTPPPVRRDPPPERAQVQPLPEPLPMPQKPLRQTVSLSADAFFDFDKSVLKPRGMRILDGMAHTLSDTQYESIFVTGHTDRIGGPGYNQRLSERRANAVRNYLVSRDISAGRIEAEGKGDTQPITKFSDCAGPKSPRVVACLQPDRRVDITVSGTKELKTASR
jgi:OOP family OmpA-OmpF porin